jgi:hypothetical protein
MWQDLGLARLVERGQRLVHQQQARAGERAADGGALLFPWKASPAGGRADAICLCGPPPVELTGSDFGANQRQTKFCRTVREQAPVLKT